MRRGRSRKKEAVAATAAATPRFFDVPAAYDVKFPEAFEQNAEVLQTVRANKSKRNTARGAKRIGGDRKYQHPLTPLELEVIDPTIAPLQTSIVKRVRKTIQDNIKSATGIEKGCVAAPS